MTNNKSENEKDNQGINTGRGFFEIHVKGHLDDSWSEWLEGLEVKLLDNGEMILFGHIGDQAALMGTLNKLYRLNLALLSVSEVKQKNDVQKVINKENSKMEKTIQFNPDLGNISMSALIIEKIHRCEDCPIRKMGMKRPHSIFARLHAWHTTWWPGWKAHQARACAFRNMAKTQA